MVTAELNAVFCVGHFVENILLVNLILILAFVATCRVVTT